MPSVRPGTPEDEDRIVDLWVGLTTYHRTIEKVWPKRWTGSRETWRANLLELLRGVWRDPARQTVFVATIDKEIVGFVRAGLHEEGPVAAHIETLFVAEQHRGAGIARALVDVAERWCREHDADEVAIEFIARNDLAKQTYEHLGYRPFMVTYMKRLGDGPKETEKR